MAYTAAALSYLIQDCPKPIVLTGAQKPIWYDGTDSKRNLTDAFLYACRGCGGVQIVFNGKVILGTRARKTFSKSFQAFSSVNYPELALIQDERLLQYITTGSRPAPRFYDALDGSVGLLKLIPGTRRELLAFMADHYDGLVIEGFGVGGLPEYDGFYDVVRQAAEAGKLIVMTTQVPNEGSDLTVYHVGGHLKHTLHEIITLFLLFVIRVFAVGIFVLDEDFLNIFKLVLFLFLFHIRGVREIDRLVCFVIYMVDVTVHV